MRKSRPLFVLGWLGILSFGHAGTNDSIDRAPGRLALPRTPLPSKVTVPFMTPLPAHAQPVAPNQQVSFAVESSRDGSRPRGATEVGSAEYFLPEDKKKNRITPEMANLNIPTDTVLIAKDTGEKIVLPAGTYRQIMILPIDSPLLEENTRNREEKYPAREEGEPKSRYASPPTDPIWVRYESLEKITIADQARRGGLDIPSHGPANLGPRVWYAKSDTADIASSAFYFVFGGLGYGIANLAGWSTGNVREITNDFEYRLIRR